MVDSQSTPLDLYDMGFEAEFRLSCSCTSSTNQCERIGLAGRYVDDANHVKAYVEGSSSGCFVRLNRKSSSLGGETLSRSPYIGVPITDSQGLAYTHSDGVTPLFAEIPAVDDGEWHTMRLTIEGYVVRLWLDGRLIAAGLDDLSTNGTVALFGQKQAIEWRNISVSNSSW
jgi:hypothetical protein